MAQSQKFSIRNIVKKEALPRIIFSSFYIYMHEDEGKMAMSSQLPHELNRVMGECNKSQPFRTYKVCQEIQLDNAQPQGKVVSISAVWVLKDQLVFFKLTLNFGHTVFTFTAVFLDSHSLRGCMMQVNI
jgi:hypothetical protein